MIERKLQTAADNLPHPSSDFSAVGERIRQKNRKVRARPRRRLVAAMILTLLLVGCVAAVSEPDYHLYNGNWWSFVFNADEILDLTDFDWNQTQKTAKKLGITLPETLGGYPVISYGRWNLTTKEIPIQLAWLSPQYLYYSTFYGVETEKAFLTGDGSTILAHTQDGADVTYGPTDDAVWRRQFGYDENDVFVASNWTLANHPLVGITTLEYEGITIYVGQIDLSTYLQPKWDVTWVDQKNGVVFSVEGDDETPDALIDCAKVIIDLNK